MTEQTIYLDPLTKDQLRTIIALKNAYAEFWENVKFSKGWDAPIANIGDVFHLLEEAAEIVVRIRTYLDATKPGPKFRIIDGNAKEYLWALDQMPNPEKFIRDLVHSTLKHGDRYVEELTVERVNQLIEEIRGHAKSSRNDKVIIEAKGLEDHIIKVWNETDLLLKSSCADESKFWNASLVKDMQQLLNQITNVKQRLILINKKRSFNQNRGTGEVPSEQPQEVQPEVPPAPQETEEQKAEREKAEREEKEKQQREAEERLKREKEREGIFKIKTVAKDTKNIEEELKEISNFANALKSKSIKPVEAIDKIGELKKKCIKNSTKLMQDLITLDELVGLEEARNAKKEEVSRVQYLLDNVESLKAKLNSLEVEIQPLAQKQKQDEELDKIAEEELQHLVESQTQSQAQTQPTPPIHQQTQKPDNTIPVEHKHSQHEQTTHKPHSESLLHPKFDLRNAWNRLKLEPKMDIHEAPDHYLIMGNIPGIHKNEIDTTVLPDGTLQISGVRIPTPEEIAAMRKQVRARFRVTSQEEEDMFLLKLGVGRFGRFVKKYKLPEGLDLDAIEGHYQDGVLVIKIPKPVHQRREPERERDRGQNRTSNHAFPFHPFVHDVPFWGNYY